MFYHIKAENITGWAFRNANNDHWTIRMNGKDRGYLYGTVHEMKWFVRDVVKKDFKNNSKVSIRKG